MVISLEKLLTKKDVARMLDISIPTVDRMRKRGTLKEVKWPGEVARSGRGMRLVRFDPAVVSELIHHD